MTPSFRKSSKRSGSLTSAASFRPEFLPIIPSTGLTSAVLSEKKKHYWNMVKARNVPLRHFSLHSEGNAQNDVVLRPFFFFLSFIIMTKVWGADKNNFARQLRPRRSPAAIWPSNLPHGHHSSTYQIWDELCVWCTGVLRIILCAFKTETEGKVWNQVALVHLASRIFFY